MPAAKPIYHNMSKPRRYEPPRHLLASDMVLFHGGDDRAGYGKDPTRTWATVNGAPPSHEVVKGYEAPTTRQERKASIAPPAFTGWGVPVEEEDWRRRGAFDASPSGHAQARAPAPTDADRRDAYLRYVQRTRVGAHEGAKMTAATTRTTARAWSDAAEMRIAGKPNTYVLSCTASNEVAHAARAQQGLRAAARRDGARQPDQMLDHPLDAAAGGAAQPSRPGGAKPSSPRAYVRPRAVSAFLAHGCDPVPPPGDPIRSWASRHWDGDRVTEDRVGCAAVARARPSRRPSRARSRALRSPSRAAF